MRSGGRQYKTQITDQPVWIILFSMLQQYNKNARYQKLCVHLLLAPLSWVFPESPGELVHPDSSKPLVPSPPPGITKKAKWNHRCIISINIVSTLHERLSLPIWFHLVP